MGTVTTHGSDELVLGDVRIGFVMLRFVFDCRLRSGLVTRRDWLRIGAGWLGCLWAAKQTTALTAAEQDQSANRIPGFSRAKSVILVFANGGQSQIDTWDPK